jgi:hypothetical protein
MAFVDFSGVTLKGANPYPVLRSNAPTVDASTAWNVTWGLSKWQGPKDLAMRWKMLWVGDTLVLEASVDDDTVIPLGKLRAIHSDHLELTLGVGENQRTWPELGHVQLGLLLGEGGAVQIRLWRKAAPNGANVSVDVAFAGSGTWKRTDRGYDVRAEIPLGPVREVVGQTRALPFSVLASDSDVETGKQETLLGSRGALRFWTEYPPTLAEFNGLVGEPDH